MTHIWFWRSLLPERKDEPCRIVERYPCGIRGTDVLIEFSDGFRVVTSACAIRPLPERHVPESSGLKFCPNCDLAKPLDEFHANRAKASGRHSWCKACSSKSRKAWSDKRVRLVELDSRLRARM